MSIELPNSFNLAMNYQSQWSQGPSQSVPPIWSNGLPAVFCHAAAASAVLVVGPVESSWDARMVMRRPAGVGIPRAVNTGMVNFVKAACKRSFGGDKLLISASTFLNSGCVTTLL